MYAQAFMHFRVLSQDNQTGLWRWSTLSTQRGGAATKAKPFNAEEKSKQRKDEESQKN